jgi:hypothetical protein
MKSVRQIALALFLLAFAPSLHAQWTGTVNISGGYWQMPSRSEEDLALENALGKAGVQMTYKTRKLLWETNLNGQFTSKQTDVIRLSVSNKGGNIEEEIRDAAETEMLDKLKGQEVWNADFKTRVLFKPAVGREYETWLQYTFKSDESLTGSDRDKYRYNKENEDWVNREELFIESALQTDHSALGGFRTSHRLGSPRRVLKGEITLQEKWQDKNSSWTKLKGVEAELENWDLTAYRLTPSSSSQIVNTSVHLQDSVITSGPVRLHIDPGVRVRGEYTHDRKSGANLEPDGTWKDSTRLRETFDFLSLAIEPYLVADFSWSKLRAHINYAPQIYGRKLTDDTHTQNLQFQRLYLVGDSYLSWTFSPSHKLYLRSKSSVSHPSYIQICWYERQGNYLTQIYRGKESLRSVTSDAVSLEYEFKYKRFSSTTTFSYTSKRDEIDQTFTNETIDGRDYQVFTWVNASNSRVLGFSEKLGWKGKILTANVGVNYNGTRRIRQETGNIKKSTDWRAWADASLRLGHGWTVGADVNYRSAVATFFTLFKGYCAFNARIQKDFKRITLTLEGKDLLDKREEKEFISENQSEAWIEVSRLNRRMIVLGIRWKFL